MNDEGRPKGAAHEITGAASRPSVARATVSDLAFLDRHAAFLAGYELGKVERREADVEDQVLARLHDRSLEALHLAKRSARHGPAFSRLVRDAGERE